MSEAILSAGSTEPSKVTGSYRLYGLKLSPSTHQVRLVLAFKNVLYDLVNVNPRSIPDWYTKIQPEGKFPSLDTGNQLLVGTAAIVEYIDDKHPEPSIYREGVDKKAMFADVLKKLEQVAQQAKELIEKKDATPSEEVQDLIARLSERLESAGTPYLGGDSPGLSDFLIYPWIHVGEVPFKLHGKDVVSDEVKAKFAPVGKCLHGLYLMHAGVPSILPLLVTACMLISKSWERSRFFNSALSRMVVRIL